MALDTGYRAAHLECSFNFSISTGTSTPIPVATSQNPVHRIRMRTYDGSMPAVGTPSNAIDIRLKGGGLKKLDLCLQDYAYNIIRPRYRLGGGTVGGNILYGSVEVKWFPVNSYAATWVTSHALVTTSWVQTNGGNGVGNQLIVTFRTGSGRVGKLVFMHGIDVPAATKVLPSGDSGIDAMVADVCNNNSPVIGLDGLPFIVGMEWNAGQNEKFFKDVWRPD